MGNERSGFVFVELLAVMARLPCSASVGGPAACRTAHLRSRRGSVSRWGRLAASQTKGTVAQI